MESTEKNEVLELAEKDLLEFEKNISEVTPKNASELFFWDTLFLEKIKTYFEAKEGKPSLSYHRLVYGRK